MTCQKCNKLILEPGVSYGVNPNAVCNCENPNSQPQVDKELRNTIKDLLNKMYDPAQTQ